MQLKCAGAVSGAVTVSDDATVEDLVRELERLAGCTRGGLKVIAGGKRFTVRIPPHTFILHTRTHFLWVPRLRLGREDTKKVS